MKKQFILSLMFLLIGAQLCFAAGDVTLNYVKQENKPKYKEGELLIKFKPSTSDSRQRQIHSKHGSQIKKEFKSLRIHHIKVKPGLSVEDAIKKYSSDPDIEYAEPNYIVTALNTPNDSLFNSLWSLHNTGQTGGTPGADIKTPEAWDITTGSNDVVVAVIDTGVDYTHEDLSANIWVNLGEIPGNGIDDDGNGYIDDIHGINAITESGNPSDDEGHGTHVAGTIGAVGNNGTGIVGVNWNVKIMGCKFLNQSGSGSDSDAIKCLEYVQTMRARGVNVVATNNSWGGGGSSHALYDAINAQREILFMAAAGNDAQEINDLYSFSPANLNLPNIISVAATNSDDNIALFSNYGKRSVYVGAPGQDIVSLRAARTDMYSDGQHFIPNGDLNAKYYRSTGTSMATPHVTGLAALLKAHEPERDWRAIKNLILSGGDVIPSLDGKTITGKRLNAHGSLTCNSQPVFSILRGPNKIFIGRPMTLSALSINCASPVGTVSVTTDSGSNIILHDDGFDPDLAAGDGIFTGIWIPTQVCDNLYFTFSSQFGTKTETVNCKEITSIQQDGFKVGDQVIMSGNNLCGGPSYCKTSMSIRFVNGSAIAPATYASSIMTIFNIPAGAITGPVQLIINGTVLTTSTQTVAVCTDSDGDGYYIDGGICGPVDCNDSDPTINPEAAEVCDNIDNNCNGQVDEGVRNIYYLDNDLDGYGTSDTPWHSPRCHPPNKYWVLDNTDCDDYNASIHPGVAEVCDGVDNNCDGQIDESFSLPCP